MNDLIFCKVCHEKMKVMETRAIILNGVLTNWRRRVCSHGCGTTSRTVEVETTITNWENYG